MAWRHLPTLHLRTHDNDALPPQQWHAIGLRQHTPLELAQQRRALLEINRSFLLLEQAIELAIDVFALVRRLLHGKVAGELIGRLIDGITLERQRNLEGALVERIVIEHVVGLEMFRLDADLAPLIDHEHAATSEEVGNGSVRELDL